MLLLRLTSSRDAGSWSCYRRAPATAILCLLVMMISLPLAAADASSAPGQRGIAVTLKATEKADAPDLETITLYKSSYALVIGNDDYTGGWPKLSNAIKDAEAIAAELESKGFEVSLYRNLSSVEMVNVFRKFFILKGEDADARLFIWYAGHGHTLDGQGYLIPVDAPIPSQSASFKLAAVALRDFGTFMRQADSKHVYAVFDSCFAGTVFSNQRAIPPPAITRATTMPVRQFLTSGDANQTVSDDGTFRELFIRAINGEERADANHDQYVTASELGLFLGDRVTNLTQLQQTPRYGKLRDKNFDRGDFVFVLPENAVAGTLASASPIQASAEITFWNSIKDSGSPDQFKAYMDSYPLGSFLQLAMLRRNKLIETSKSASAEADRISRALTLEFELVSIDQDLETTSVSNVREAPSPSATQVARLEAGDQVWAIGETQVRGKRWYQVARDGLELGYVYGPLLKSVRKTDSERTLVQDQGTSEIMSDAPELSSLQTDKQLVLQDVPAQQPADRPLQVDELLSQRIELILETDASIARTASGTPSTLTLQDTVIPTEQVALESAAAMSVASTQHQASGLTTEFSETGHPEAVSARQPILLSALTETTEAAVAETIPPFNTTATPPANTTAAGVAAIEPALIQSDTTDIQTGTADIQTGTDEPAVPLGRLVETDDEPMQLAGLSKGFSSSKNTEYSDSVLFYLERANAGDLQVQSMLGELFESGQMVQQDIDAAVYWYRKAAEQGDLATQMKLGILYKNGVDISRNMQEAAFWLGKAAHQGNAYAQQSLGFMYETGEGVARNNTEAAHWYLLAAKQGRPVAQNNLGRLYHLGLGVKQDLTQAEYWYRQAVAQGNEDARDNLERLKP